MKIIEELESLENGDNPALFAVATRLKDKRNSLLFDFKATLAALDALQLKYPNHRLLIGNRDDDLDWSEFTLFGEREETAAEKQKRLEKESKAKEAEKAKIQKQIEQLKKRQAELEKKDERQRMKFSSGKSRVSKRSEQTMKLLNCPVCLSKPRVQRYNCAIQNVKMIRIVCPTGCSSTFATRKDECAEELWRAFCNWGRENPEKLKKYIK